MVFDWDDAKRRANLAKHGVDFALAAEFAWAKATITPDLRKDYGEPREVAIGPIGERLHVLTFTRRGVTIRIISLRRANPRERKIHERKTKTQEA